MQEKTQVRASDTTPSDGEKTVEKKQ